MARSRSLVLALQLVVFAGSASCSRWSGTNVESPSVQGPPIIMRADSTSQRLYISIGKADGVTPGDQFHILSSRWAEPADANAEVLGTVEVLQVFPHLALARTVDLQEGIDLAGLQIRLVGKAESRTETPPSHRRPETVMGEPTSHLRRCTWCDSGNCS